MGKVGLGPQRFLYRLVFDKLAAIVKGDGMHLLDVWRQHPALFDIKLDQHVYLGRGMDADLAPESKVFALNSINLTPSLDKQLQPHRMGLPGPLNRFSPVDNKTPPLMTKAHRR